MVNIYRRFGEALLPSHLPSRQSNKSESSDLFFAPKMKVATWSASLITVTRRDGDTSQDSNLLLSYCLLPFPLFIIFCCLFCHYLFSSLCSFFLHAFSSSFLKFVLSTVLLFPRYGIYVVVLCHILEIYLRLTTVERTYYC